MRRALTVTTFLSLLLVLGACSTTQPGTAPTTPAETTPTPTIEATPTEEAEPERTTVDWTQYPTAYQQIIDEDTAAGDCDALQTTFDAAPDDWKLLAYIDEALTLADCY